MGAFRNGLTRITVAATLLAVSGCLDTGNAPQATNVIGLRGAVYSTEEAKPVATHMPAPLASAQAVASMGPDEDVATASIAASLNAHPQFDIEMGYAPGDGAQALKAAMADALAKSSPVGQSASYKLRGTVTIANLDTGNVQVDINWQVDRADGATIGQISQRGETAPSDIAAYWGRFAKSAAEPAAEGINALISAESNHRSAETRQAGNAS